MKKMAILLMFSVGLIGFVPGRSRSINAVASAPTPQHPQRAARVVDLKALDGTILKASYFAAGKPGPGVLLFHQTNRTRKSWDGVAAQLAAAGIHTLTLDLRGFGESGGKPYDKLTDAEIAKDTKMWAGDIDVAWQYLVSQPGVYHDAIGLGGAGVDGVNNSVQAVQRHTAEVKSLALLSGETFLPGLRFLRQSSQLPELFVVADSDEYPPTAEAMELLYSTSSSASKRFVHYAGEKAPWKWYEIFDIGKVPAAASHGTDLFEAHPELPGQIVDWFVATLIKTPGHAPASLKDSGELPFSRALNQLWTLDGVAQITHQLKEAREKDPQAQLFPEIAVNIFGTDHLRVNETKLAVEIMKLNVLAYPDSANASDSLGDAYLADGQKEPARQYAEKTLALLDSDTIDSEEWRNLIRKSAQGKIKQLDAENSSQAPQGVRSRAEETLEWWNHIGNKLIAMAKDFPEDKYDFKVQNDERTFAQNLLHIAAVDYDVASKVSGSHIGPDFGKDKHNPSRDVYKTKVDVVKLLEDAVAAGATVIKEQSDAGLDKTMEFGWETGRHVVRISYVWMACIEHSAEHFGQLVVYYRANNLVPPESRR